SILSSNQNMIVRLDIRNQSETSNLCTAISSYAWELVYSEVVKKQLRQGDEPNNECTCATLNSYLLPSSHRIQLGIPLDITNIHPCKRVHPVFPPLNLLSQEVDPDRLAVLKNPQMNFLEKAGLGHGPLVVVRPGSLTEPGQYSAADRIKDRDVMSSLGCTKPD
ncbi:hypothetical protein V1517DRAFT_266376, partial [Lipomyces orientalis]